MSRISRLILVLVWPIWASQGGVAQAQWGYPGGFGGCGWMGWGVGTATRATLPEAWGPS